MDSTQWPWSWEEEAEWKAELEERDDSLLEELINDAFEDDLAAPEDVLVSPRAEEPAENTPEKYSVAA